MRYFVVFGGQKYGPADITLLNQWVTENRVKPTTMLEPEDGSPAVAASTILKFPEFQTPPPPRPGPGYAPGNGPGDVPGAFPGTGGPMMGGFQPGPMGNQGFSSYPRGNYYDATAANSAFTWSIICSIIGFFCCPIVFSVIGILQGKKARDLGHPNGNTAYIVGIVSLTVGVGFGILMLLLKQR